jgi:hypothetical protein
MPRVLISASIVLFATICCVDDRSKQTTVTNSFEAKPKMQRNTPEGRLNIKNTRGVVVLNKYGKGDFVRFYNADGSLWYEFTFYFDESGGKFPYANDDFRPFAFHPGYFLLVLRCTETPDNFFEVVVNEESGLRKYVRANDPVLKLETWDKFVLSVFAVTFDQKANPILQAPNGQPNTVAIPSDANFRPVETDGDWLKIRWDAAADPAGKPKPIGSGWIRWKNAGKLLVDFSYFA